MEPAADMFVIITAEFKIRVLLLISSIMFCDLEVNSSKLEEDFCPSLVTHSSASGCHGNPLVCHPS